MEYAWASPARVGPHAGFVVFKLLFGKGDYISRLGLMFFGIPKPRIRVKTDTQVIPWNMLYPDFQYRYTDVLYGLADWQTSGL